MVVYELDAENFSTLEGFYDEVSRVMIPGATWGHSLDAFNDILRGGFGTPDEGFTLRWTNHELSRTRLGYSETARQLELSLQRCHPSRREALRRDLALARAGQGPTVFDWLLGIIRMHGAGGDKSGDNVTLELA